MGRTILATDAEDLTDFLTLFEKQIGNTFLQIIRQYPSILESIEASTREERVNSSTTVLRWRLE